MIEFAPPFQYSYECSSSFLAAYAIVYIEMYLITGFVLPLSKFIVLWIIERYGDVCVSGCSDSSIKLQNLPSSENQIGSDNRNISNEVLDIATPRQLEGEWSKTKLLNIYGVFRKIVGQIKLFREVDKTATVILFFLFIHIDYLSFEYFR
jgi:hypothetical protein